MTVNLAEGRCAGRLAAPDAASSTGCSPPETYAAISRCRTGVAADPTQPSWSQADLRSTLETAYRSVRFPDPPAAFRRPMGSSAAPPASADCSTYSPRFPGLRLSSKVVTRGRLPRFVLPGAARRASPGVSCPSAHARPAGPLARGFRVPRYVPAPGFRPSRRLPPREPSRPCFMPERSWASPFRGFLLRDRRCLSRGPSPPRRWLPAGCTLRGGKERTESAARSASPSPGLPVPGVRMPRPAVRQSPESAPLLGFILPEACDPPAAPPRPGGHPPLGFRTTFELAPRGRPGPPGSSTTSGLTRLREPGCLSEVLSPF